MFLQAVNAAPQVDHLRYWMEIAYFASGIVLACLGCGALYQLILARRQLALTRDSVSAAVDAVKTAREDIQVRSQREAVCLAASQIEKFADETMPRINQNIYAMREGGLQMVLWRPASTNFDAVVADELERARTWLDQLMKNDLVRTAGFENVNKLEAYALYFVKGAADEMVAFPTTARIFCDIVEWHAPLLIELRHLGIKPGITPGPFINTVELYNKWKARLRLEEARKIHDSVSGSDVAPIPPIGTM